METDNSKKKESVSPRIVLRIQLLQKVEDNYGFVSSELFMSTRSTVYLNKKLSGPVKVIRVRAFFPTCTFSPDMPSYSRRLSKEVLYLDAYMCVCFKSTF